MRPRWSCARLSSHDQLRSTGPINCLDKRFLSVSHLIGGLAITLDEYLVTRTVELVTHIDDLAASIDVPTPTLPEAALVTAVDCMVEIARLRHGDLAVVRALARRERDPLAALRVF